MNHEDISHLAFSILHGTFTNDSGGCSCYDCSALRAEIEELKRDEAATYYNEHYPPAGGL